MVVLGFDTSTKSASVSLMKDGSILGEIIINDKRTHSQKIMPILENLLELSDMDLDDVDLLAVSIGPGSFTGIRIALSTVKAISHVKKLDIVGVNSLESLAYNVNISDKIIIPVIDAQKDQVYTGGFRHGKCGFECIQMPTVMSVSEVIDYVNGNEEDVVIVGEAVEKFGDSINNKYITVSDSIYNIPKASSICALALDKYKRGEDVYTCYDIEALYIRKSQAEMQYEEKQRKLGERNDL